MIFCRNYWRGCALFTGQGREPKGRDTKFAEAPLWNAAGHRLSHSDMTSCIFASPSSLCITL